MGDNDRQKIRDDFRKASVIASHSGTCWLCKKEISPGHRLIKMDYWAPLERDPGQDIEKDRETLYVHLDCAEMLVLNADVGSPDFNTSEPADPFETAINVDEPEN